MMNDMSEHIAFLCQQYPAISDMIENYGDITINDYLSRIQHQCLDDIMPSDDLIDEIEAYFVPFFGPEIAMQAALATKKSKCLSTANHHHFAFEYMTVQENILFGLYQQLGKEQQCVIPFIAASNLNLTNTLYPRGLLLYDCNIEGAMRIPLYHWKKKRECIARLESVAEQMVFKAKDRVYKEVKNNTISYRMGDTIIAFFDDVLLSDEVMKCKTLSDQTTIVNAMLSKRYFKDRQEMHLYMPLETLASRLLKRDLMHEDSLPYRILFNKKLRSLLINNLEGVAGCWTEDISGTHFFWGLDSRDILFPMHLTEENGESFLSGRNSLDEDVFIPFRRESILECLDKHLLLPGLFLCFLEIHLLRDFTVFGGYYQPTYLKQMINGVVRTLLDLKLFEREALIIKKKQNYMSLGITFLSGQNDFKKYPISTLELLKEPVETTLLEEKLRIFIKDSFCFLQSN